MFYNLTNLKISIRITLEKVNKKKTTEKKLQNLKQRTLATIYIKLFKTLAYKIL